MIDFIPVQYYEQYFDYAVLIMVAIALRQCMVGSIFKKDVVELNATWGFIICMILILYMGLRPVAYIFGDTYNYARGFEAQQNSGAPFVWRWEGEWFFYNAMNWFAKVSNIHAFFLFCAFMYVFPLWLAMRRIFKAYNYLPFLVIICMFTFWTYGVNGIRNGIGASLFILALTYVNNIPILAFLMFLSLGFHKSVYLMIGAAVLSWFLKNSYLYLAGWIVAVIASFLFGETIQQFFATFDLFALDDRFSHYIAADNVRDNLQAREAMGFRWDYIIYSSMAVIVGYYFIFTRKFKDEYYHWIYNIFLITNAFWILVIRASFSNRFAQISWFIMPIVLIYPFMKKRFWINHEKMVGYALLLFYAFAFYYNILR